MIHDVKTLGAVLGLTCLTLLACDDPALEPDGPDLGPADAGTGDAGQADAGDAARGVMACQQAAAAYASLCTSDGNRTCHVASYAAYCAEAVEPAAMAAALDCLRANSSSDSCRTFADPSGAASCVAMALAAVNTAARGVLLADYLALCPNSPSTTHARFEPPLPMLSPAQLMAMADCVRQASACADADACLLAGPQATIAACYP